MTKQSLSVFKFATALTMLTALLQLSYADVPSSAEEVNPIKIGQTIPALTLKDADGKAVDLNATFKDKPALVVFYRGGWCPYCNTHLSNLRKIEAPLLKKGFQIIAISPDLPKYLNETGNKNKLSYTLLSDSDMAAAKALGLAFKVDEATIKLYHTYDIDLEKSSGQKHHLLPVPAAFLVNKKGEVTFSFVAPNYKVRVDNNVLMAAADSLLSAE